MPPKSKLSSTTLYFHFFKLCKVITWKSEELLSNLWILIRTSLSSSSMSLMFSSSCRLFSRNFLQVTHLELYVCFYETFSSALWYLYSLSSSSLCLCSISICSFLVRNSSSPGSACVVKIWTQVRSDQSPACTWLGGLQIWCPHCRGSGSWKSECSNRGCKNLIV